MKALLAALLVGVLGCTVAPASAQEKKSEPAGEATKTEVKKTEQVKKQTGDKTQSAEVNKDAAKKKVKRGGC